MLDIKIYKPIQTYKHYTVYLDSNSNDPKNSLTCRAKIATYFFKIKSIQWLFYHFIFMNHSQLYTHIFKSFHIVSMLLQGSSMGFWSSLLVFYHWVIMLSNNRRQTQLAKYTLTTMIKRYDISDKRVALGIEIIKNNWNKILTKMNIPNTVSTSITRSRLQTIYL